MSKQISSIIINHKLVLLVAVLSLLIGVATFRQAAAHTTVGSDNISAVLHISPDDNPKIDQPSVLNFEVATDNLKLTDYDFVITVTNPGGQINPLETSVSGDTVSAPNTFQAAGEYQVELTGTNKNHPGELVSLTMTQEVVDEASGLASNKLLLALGGVAVTVVVSGLLFMVARRATKRSSKADA